MEEREEVAKTLLRKEYADFSGSQADICLQCYATDTKKKKKREKEIESKDHTGIYKKEDSLQNALVVGVITTVHLKKIFVYWGATLRKSISPYACSQNRSSTWCTAAVLGIVLGHIKLHVSVISADLVLLILWVYLILYSWSAVTFAGFCESQILTISIVTVVQSAPSFGFSSTS